MSNFLAKYVVVFPMVILTPPMAYADSNIESKALETDNFLLSTAAHRGLSSQRKLYQPPPLYPLAAVN